VVLHGGEPLLAGADRLISLVARVRAAVPRSCDLSVAMQTNGVLLDERTLSRLSAYGVRVGVSIDGTPEDHDRHRRGRDGNGSHAAVAQALALLTTPRHRASYAGLLSVVDPSTAPLQTFEALLAYEPPAIDFLLPHANWARPPERPAGLGPAPYGAWLAKVFDRWYDAPRRETGIRLFEEVMSLLLGGDSRSDQVGLSPVAVVVVESDGAIEQVDSLKSAYPGACATGLNVRTDSFDAALDHPGIVARHLGTAALSDTCLSCSLHQVCGAGHYAHRFRPGTGFRNPSVYCADLQLLIRHVRGRMSADLLRLAAR
jgi:uncharacterized protein